MPLPHIDDTPPWVYQEQETPWISTEQETPATLPKQVPLPPIQASPSREETKMSLVIQLFRSRLGLMKLHSIRQQFHEDVLPPAPSFDETPTIPSVACILRLLFHPRRLHSFGGAPVLCVPCVHFEPRDTQSDV